MVTRSIANFKGRFRGVGMGVRCIYIYILWGSYILFLHAVNITSTCTEYNAIEDLVYIWRRQPTWASLSHLTLSHPWPQSAFVCSAVCKLNTKRPLSAPYNIHVPGWLQKWLNLITAPGSVSNEPGSVTWLATKYLKTVSWRNHTEKLTTWWPQNISFWHKINIPSSYFTILMLNCLKNTLKLQFDSYVTAVRFLT